MPSPNGIDQTLKLEAVYLSAPIPRNLAVLKAIFDKIYFPGVYLPKEGFDVRDISLSRYAAWTSCPCEIR